MKIRIGQRFADDEFKALMRTPYLPRVNITRGIFAYGKWVEERISPPRTPVIFCTSHPKPGADEGNPWLDVIEPDEGYALFNGDNKWPGQDPFIGEGGKRPIGNRKFLEVAELYKDRSRRLQAPPVMVFRATWDAERRRRLKEFCGYGVPVQFSLRTQRVPEPKRKDRRSPRSTALRRGRYFTNLLIELTMFDLTKEAGELDWQWVDDRANPDLSSDETLIHAPWAWRTWVAGEDASQVRRSVIRDRITKKDLQGPSPGDDASNFQRIMDFYGERPKAFEGLAALVAARLIGQRCERKWVNIGQGDGGVDFVCLLKVGNPELRTGETGVVVIGQAKRWDPGKPVTPDDVSRLAARLRRGWIGAFVTTSYFTDQAQTEVLADGYPLLLINGKAVAAEVSKCLNESGLDIDAFLAEELAWYERSRKPWTPARAMEAFNVGVVVDLSEGSLPRDRCTFDAPYTRADLRKP